MALLEALRFLTVLPVPSQGAPSERNMARSIVYFPLVGALLGGLLSLMDRGLGYLGPGQLPSAVLLVAWIALTGGLHLDGLADTADGLLGGWTPERRLIIMKDSRLGTFGALALIAALLLKFALLGQLPTEWRAPGLILAPALARWAMVLAVAKYPPARDEGLGHLFRQHVGLADFVRASVMALGVSLLCTALWGPALLAVAWLVATLFNRVVMRSIGGLTGDTHGALCEMVELCILFVVMLLGRGRQPWWS